MKKSLSILLILSLLGSLLVGCGVSEGVSMESVSEMQSESEAASIPESAPESAVSEEPSEVSEESAIENSTVEEEMQEEIGEFSIDTYPWGTVELPLTEENKSFSYFFATQPFMMSYAGSFDYQDLPYFVTMEERTGIHLELQVVTLMEVSEKFSLMIASGDACNMIEGMDAYYSGGVDKAIEEEVIYAFDDIVGEYMPNYDAWLDYNEEYRRALTSPSGHLYGAGSLKVGTISATMGGLIRQDWLDEAHMDIPVTYDDMEKALEAFKNNGHPNALWMNTGLNDTASNYNISAGYDVSNGFIVKDGVIEYSFVSDDFLDYVTMLHDWWVKEYIYRDFITVEGEIDSGLVLNDAVGIWSGSNSNAELMEASSTTGLRISPFSDLRKTEDQIIHIGNSTNYVGGAISIATTTAQEDIELLAKWMDYQYTYDGFMLGNFGEEGVAYEYDENGEPQLTDLVVNSDEYITPVGIVLFTKFGGCGITYDVREYFAWSDSDWEATEIWKYNHDSAYSIPMGMQLSAEESEIVNQYYNDLKTYIDENLLKFITGETSLDQWNDYTAVVDSMGIQKVIDAYQSAYDRYAA